MNLSAFILAPLTAIAQQTWQTPAWAVVLVLLGFAAQGVWFILKLVIDALNTQTKKREEAEAHARALEDNLVLVEVRAVAAEVTRIAERMEKGDGKFDAIAQWQRKVDSWMERVDDELGEIRDAMEHKAA